MSRPIPWWLEIIKITNMLARHANSEWRSTPASATNAGWILVGTSDVPVEGQSVLVFSAFDQCTYTAYTQDGRWLHANGDGSEKYVIRNVTHWQPLPAVPDSAAVKECCSGEAYCGDPACPAKPRPPQSRGAK